MSQDENKPKNNVDPKIEKSIRIDESRNYSEKIGDFVIKGEDQRQYAKPFINEIVRPNTEPTTPQTPPNTDNKE